MTLYLTTDQVDVTSIPDRPTNATRLVDVVVVDCEDSADPAAALHAAWDAFEAATAGIPGITVHRTGHFAIASVEDDQPSEVEPQDEAVGGNGGPSDEAQAEAARVTGQSAGYVEGDDGTVPT